MHFTSNSGSGEMCCYAWPQEKDYKLSEKISTVNVNGAPVKIEHFFMHSYVFFM